MPPEAAWAAQRPELGHEGQTQNRPPRRRWWPASSSVGDILIWAWMLLHYDLASGLASRPLVSVDPVGKSVGNVRKPVGCGRLW